MIQPQSINISTLPSIPLASRKQLPVMPGIYICIDAQDQIQYIGQSKNINQRWSSHHRTAQLEKLKGIRIAYLVVTEPGLLPQIEQAMIEYFKPRLNNKINDLSPDRGLKVRIKKRQQERINRWSQILEFRKIS